MLTSQFSSLKNLCMFKDDEIIRTMILKIAFGIFCLEISVHDTCSDGGAALSESQKLLTWASTNKEIPLIGK